MPERRATRPEMGQNRRAKNNARYMLPGRRQIRFLSRHAANRDMKRNEM